MIVKFKERCPCCEKLMLFYSPGFLGSRRTCSTRCERALTVKADVQFTVWNVLPPRLGKAYTKLSVKLEKLFPGFEAISYREFIVWLWLYHSTTSTALLNALQEIEND